MGDPEPLADMPYEVDDEVAVLSAAFGRQNQQSVLYLTLAVVVATVFGILAVVYMKYTGKEDIRQQAQTFRQGMTEYIRRSAHNRNEEVSYLQDQHMQKLGQVEGSYRRKLDSITGEKKALEVKLQGKEKQLKSSKEDTEYYKRQCKEKDDEMYAIQRRHEEGMSVLRRENEEMSTKLSELIVQASAQQETVNRLQCIISAQESENKALEAKVKELEKAKSTKGWSNLFSRGGGRVDAPPSSSRTSNPNIPASNILPTEADSSFLSNS